MVLVIPPPVTVIVPVLVEPVFSLTSIKIVPLPVPLDGETVSHDALLDAVQDTFDVIFAFVPPANDGGDHDVFPTSRVVDGAAAPAAWTTVIDLVIPPPETVIVPLLLVVLVFAVTFSVIEPLPDPLDGETVSQEEALLDADHDTFDVIDTFVFAADDVGVHDVRATSRDDWTVVPACVTEIVRVIPPPETVIVPVLAEPVFALTSIKIVPLPVPLDGETVSQDVALLDAVHDTFDVIWADVLPANAGGVQAVRETLRVDWAAAPPA